MTVSLQDFSHSRSRTDLPDIRPGYVVQVHQKITETKKVGKKEETKERIQIFEGLVIGRSGRKGLSATITVRKISDGIGVERIFPLNSPAIEKITLVKDTKARRAKLYYMRDRFGKATKPKGDSIEQKDVLQTPDKLDNSTAKKDDNKKSDKNPEIKQPEKKKEVEQKKSPEEKNDKSKNSEKKENKK